MNHVVTRHYVSPVMHIKMKMDLKFIDVRSVISQVNIVFIQVNFYDMWQ